MDPEQFIQDIARQAGKVTLGFFKKAEVQYTKAHSLDVVTQADLASNVLIVEAIKKNFPDDNIISEEQGEHTTGNEYTWIIDPLDGTLNFSKGIPLYSVLIARARNGEIELAAMYDPVHDELFYAKKGGGASLNGAPIACSDESELQKVVGGFNSTMRPKNVEIAGKLVEAASGKLAIVSLYAAGTMGAYTASGRIGWWLFILGGGGIWDLAAPYLICREAGCKVTDHTGAPWNIQSRGILAANPMLHAKLLEAIKKVL